MSELAELPPPPPPPPSPPPPPPPGDWRAILGEFALRGVGVRCATSPAFDPSPTFPGLPTAERAEVHALVRRLGLGSRSEGSDRDGTRAVTAFRTARPPAPALADAAAEASPVDAAAAAGAAHFDDRRAIEVPLDDL